MQVTAEMREDMRASTELYVLRHTWIVRAQGGAPGAGVRRSEGTDQLSLWRCCQPWLVGCYRAGRVVRHRATGRTIREAARGVCATAAWDVRASCSKAEALRGTGRWLI
jgi:hypothetical protein